MHTLSQFLFTITFVFVLSACGGGGDSAPAQQVAPSTVNVTYSKGPVDDASAILVDEAGNTVAGPINTSNGNASFTDVTYQGLVYAKFSGGNYTDEATGINVALASSFQMRSGVVNVTSGSTLPLVATPLTEIAFRRAESTNGGVANLADLSANQTEASSRLAAVADEYGLDGIELTTVKPTPMQELNGGTSDADKYGTVLAAITQQELNSGVSTPTDASLATYINSNANNVDVAAFNTAVSDLQSNSNTSSYISGAVVNSIIEKVGIPAVDGYSVGGSVSGLTGLGLKTTIELQNNGVDDLSIASNGAFTFANGLADGDSYEVTVSGSPTGQICNVSNGSGSIAGSNIRNIVVTCMDVVTATFTVGGTVTGMNGVTYKNNLVLQNYGVDDLSISADGVFTFTTPLSNSESYLVTVSGTPLGLVCSVTNGGGTIAASDITNVAIDCLVDSDGDGIADSVDSDDDNDGVPDSSDAFPLDATEDTDTDNDGTGNNADTDDDNDTVPDIDDSFPLDPMETADSDGDGVGDNADVFPNDATETVDSDDDGVGDNGDAFPNDATETADSDGDGVGDNADDLPFDATETVDSDGDGVGDNADAFPDDPAKSDPVQMGGAMQRGAPLNLSKVVSTFAGSGSVGTTDGIGTAASFHAPMGITTDGTNLYVADNYKHQIRQIVIATGEVTTLAGSVWPGFDDGIGTAASFNFPEDITTDGTNLYVADSDNYKIRQIVIATGEVTTLAGSSTIAIIDGTGMAASFSHPDCITTDGTHLYVCDANVIRQIVIATGEVTTLAGSGAADSVDDIGTAASFNYPLGITTDASHLYVADSNNNVIRQIVIATGEVTTLAGSGAADSVDGIGTMASIYYPVGITTDGSNLYVTQTGSHKIRQIVIATGEVTTLAGSGSIGAVDGIGTAASFNYPDGITTDGNYLFVDDMNNSIIRKVE